MNSSRQEVLCKYLPLKRRIGILLWILRDESDGKMNLAPIDFKESQAAVS